MVAKKGRKTAYPACITYAIGIIWGPFFGPHFGASFQATSDFSVPMVLIYNLCPERSERQARGSASCFELKSLQHIVLYFTDSLNRKSCKTIAGAGLCRFLKSRIIAKQYPTLMDLFVSALVYK